MRIVCISDTHNWNEQLVVPDGDVLIHAGDSTSVGDINELEAFANWFRSFPHKHKVLIAGNHERTLDPRNALYGPSREIVEEFTYLFDSGVTIDGVNFYGTPWQFNLHHWGFHTVSPERKWAGIPDDTHILITHIPPKGIQDMTSYGVSLGCPYLTRRVYEVKPKLHVFGHVHESNGIHEENGTHFVNAASITRQYRPRPEQYQAIELDFHYRDDPAEGVIIPL